MSKNKQHTTNFPLTTEIDFVAVKGEYVHIKRSITYGEAIKIPKVKGWRYIFYEKGFCSMKENRKTKQ